MLESLLAAERPGAAEGGAEGVPGTPEIWEGLNVADLYAGTGALGIEALSRGAGWCDFFETDASARGVVARNLKATGFEDRARVLGLDAGKAVSGGARDAFHVPYGVVLLDPPYRDSAVATVVERLTSGSLLDLNAIVAVEHSRDVPLRASYGEATLGGASVAATTHLERVRERRHGDTVLSIYRQVQSASRGVVDGDHRDLSR